MLLPEYMTHDELIHAGMLEPDNSLAYALAVLAESLMAEVSDLNEALDCYMEEFSDQ